MSMQFASSEICNYIHQRSLLIEKELDRLTSIQENSCTKLLDAARYALLGSGKRLRPLFTLATSEMLGVNTEIALTPACAIELIHTYSLIHDDLPCMDNDDYRRGKLTVHRQYDQGHAVLTGDFLLTYAFEVLAKDPQLDPQTKIELISALAYYSGEQGMIGGQVMDLSWEGQSIHLDDLKLLHSKKTGALITASIEFGAILAKAETEQLYLLRSFGQKIGLTFQITDDILDVTESEAKHGRTIGSDILKEKSTYVSLLGIEKAKTYALSCYQQALNSLKLLNCDTSILEEISHFIIERKY